MPTNSKVGVSDIAKHAGVSIGTVSNYLNYPERVSETLKAKIGAAIQELGYVPRRAAPSPAQTTTGTPIRPLRVPLDAEAEVRVRLFQCFHNAVLAEGGYF